ncbi:hypothetical protein J6590_026651 [Homalodisca vitripennis]|nr:hypothetical protein J6590_026651 [Homalodisca vitripennis]
MGWDFPPSRQQRIDILSICGKPITFWRERCVTSAQDSFDGEQPIWTQAIRISPKTDLNVAIDMLPVYRGLREKKLDQSRGEGESPISPYSASPKKLYHVEMLSDRRGERDGTAERSRVADR